MLRKRLLILFGGVVTLLLIAGLGVVLVLQGVLQQLDQLSDDGVSGVSTVTDMQVDVATLRGELKLAEGTDGRVDAARWDRAIDSLRGDLNKLASVPEARRAEPAEGTTLPALVDGVVTVRDDLASEDPAVRAAGRASAGGALESMRDRLDAVHAALRSHAQSELGGAINRLRNVALAMGLGFVIALNALIIFLSRIAGMILKPIDRLVEGSRLLAREQFDHRVELDGRDEFGELARAYNSLAAQLQANEQRKIETLYQVARTLNHELNNAIAIIQLQLSLAARGSPNGALEAERLREIQQALSRMTRTVSALTRVRRIVLTDYLSGVKMLDLEASVADPPASEQPAGAEPVARASAT